MIRRILLLTIAAICTSISTSYGGEFLGHEDGDAILLGHNLTPTTYTLKGGEWTLGTYALAYGFTDWWTIGTSPWLIGFYNMPNITSRTAFTTDGFFQQLAFEAIYFDTVPYGLNNYDQQSLFFRLTGTHKFGSFYSVHASLGYQYFFHENHPFSLRLVSGNADKYESSLSTLHEFRFGSNFGMFLEFGALGLNYVSPYWQYGASFFWKWSYGYLQLGLSRSEPIKRPHFPFYYRMIWESQYKYVIAIIHPEIHLQFYF